MDELNMVPGRLNMVTVEIRTITRQTQQMVLSAAIEIGKRLKEAKELVPYGKWGEYLQNEVEYSQSTANNFMRIYEEYGSNQMSLFGGDSQAIGNLTYSKALKLLTLPQEERETFAEENNVADMSTRELDAALKARDEAIRKAKEAEEAKDAAELAKEAAVNEAEMAFRKVDELQAGLDAELEKAEADSQEKIKKLEADLRRVQEETKKAEDAKADLAKKLDKAVAAEKTAKKELKEAKENPVVPESIMAQMRSEEAQKAAKQAVDAVEAEVKAMDAKLRHAEEEKEQLAVKLEAAKKAIQLTNPDLIIFREQFTQLQEINNKLRGCLMKIRNNDPAQEDKLRGALNTVLQKMMEG